MASSNIGGSQSSITGIHHVNVYVSNNKQSAYFYNAVLGFHTTGLSRCLDHTTIAIERSDIRLLLTSPLTAASPVAEHIRLHGEGIKDIAFEAADVDAVFALGIACGAHAVQTPTHESGSGGTMYTACISACGDLVHSIVDSSQWHEPLLPGFQRALPSGPATDTALDSIDHVAVALAAGELERWVDFYTLALGFVETHQEQVSTEYTAMHSKVVQTPNATVRLSMMEPAAGPRKSQIDDYIRNNEGPGAQHLALRSHDIVRSVSSMAGAIEFLWTPDTYYDSLPARVGDVSTEIEVLRRYGILVDRDPSGLLLQVFTKPIGARPTLFLEVIERRGAEGFGSGNIRALFEAVERAQSVSEAL